MGVGDVTATNSQSMKTGLTYMNMCLLNDRVMTVISKQMKRYENIRKLSHIYEVAFETFS